MQTTSGDHESGARFHPQRVRAAEHRSSRLVKRDLVLLVVLWCAFLARGLFYASILPIWEGYDEPYHFSYMQYVVATHALPTLSTPLSREVGASLHVLPLPWMLTLQAIPKPVYTHDDFWKVPPSGRDLLEKQFRGIPAQWAMQPSPEHVKNYEAQQPPLYYILCLPLLLALRNQTLATQIFVVRYTGVAFASLAIPLAFGLVRRATRNSTAAYRVLALAVLMPELYVNLGRVSNEVLALVIYTALLYAFVRFSEELPRSRMIVLAGALIGIGLLTKAYFLTAVPAFFVIVVFYLRRYPEQWRRTLISSSIAALLFLAIASPWYVHVHRSTGSWSGLQPAAEKPHSTALILSNIPRVNWRSGILSVGISHIWFGAWSFLRLPTFWYVVFAAGYGLVLIGILVHLRRMLAQKRIGIYGDAVAASFSLYVFFCLGLAYDIVLLFVSVGASSSTGWYMYCLVIAEVLLVYFGLQGLFPTASFTWVVPAVVLAFALLDLYGTHFMLVPYYAGVISHTAAGQVSPARFSSLAAWGISGLLQRLTTNKPAFLTPETMAMLWFTYVAATVTVVVLSWRWRTFPSNGAALD